jgi:DnaJ-class molecular chaperone
MSQADYYTVLGVSQSAAPEEIKSAYRKLAFEYHPDRTGGDPESADRMKAVNEAYAVLSDDQKRREYDTLRSRFGASAAGEFRKSYSQQDIFKGSDIEGIFEEMARSFGLRGFDDIFKEFYGNGRTGAGANGTGGKRNPFFVSGKAGTGKGLGKFPRMILEKLTGVRLPKDGIDYNDAISLSTDEAVRGGPFAYRHRSQGKKLVVKIPPGIRHGQRIRLNGMGQPGIAGGKPGDLYLRVKVRDSLLEKLKRLAALLQRKISGLK